MAGSATAGRRWLALGIVLRAATIAVCLLAFVSPGAEARGQVSFATPEQGFAALVAAVQAGKAGKLAELLGPGSGPLVSSGDPVADAQARDKFLAAYNAASSIARKGDDRALLVVGTDGWTFPFPLVETGGTWRFDSRAGAEEILDRRIGANELSTIETCHAYVDAQREYAERDRNRDGFLEYAQRFLSTPGKQDGLYWRAAAGQEESPLGPLIADARAQGYSTRKQDGRKPYHGYFYRILKGQGPAAPGGAYDYVVSGHMMGGFALVAFPARYGVSGIMTFIVNHDGVVYQKDLGPETSELARRMTLFNPDPSWSKP